MSHRPRAVVLGVAVACLAAVLGVVFLRQVPTAPPIVGTTPTREATPSATAAGSTALHWIIGGATLGNLLQASPADAGLLQSFFDNPRTIVPGSGIPPGWQSVAAKTFTSVQSLQKVVSSGVGSGTQAVLYDNESWSLTPVGEQEAPAQYEAMAGQLVHQRHLLFVSTPAMDLVTVLGVQPGETRDAAYLRLNIAGEAARAADVIDIQAQGEETNLAQFTSFVKQATAQARQANPQVIVLAGITTNHSGNRASAEQMFAAVQATRSIVDGYWLNDPAGGTACPNCTGPYPAVSLAFLRQLINS